MTKEELTVMTKTTNALIDKLIKNGESRLAWRVWWLHVRIVAHEIHKNRMNLRTAQLREESRQLTIDLYVKDFSIDLEKEL